MTIRNAIRTLFCLCIAWLGQLVGIDLWGFRTADGRCIRAALDFLLPYAVRTKQWNYQQIGGFHGDALLHQMQRAQMVYRDPAYAAAARKLNGDKNNLETCS